MEEISKDLSLRGYAHLGDSVWELFVREKVVLLFSKSEQMHKMTIRYVNADFQAELLNYLEQYLSDDEKELTRRARNIPVNSARRTNQTAYRQATAFEALIGRLHFHDKNRLEQLFEIIKNYEKFSL